MINVFARMKDGRFVFARQKDGALTAPSGPPAGSPAELYDEWPRELREQGFDNDFSVAWFDLEAPSARELSWLGRQFHFHPLAIEDCSHFDQRPKIEEYSGHLFLVIHGLKQDLRDRLEVVELHCFLTKKCVVTVHSEAMSPLCALQERIERDRAELPEQADFILHKILDQVMDANPMALNLIEEEMDELDEAVLIEARGIHVEQIHDLQHLLNQVRHVFAPEREIFGLIANGGFSEISDQAAVYFRDLLDHSIRMVGVIEELRDGLWAIRDAYLAVAAHRTNETMKRLTAFSVVFLPLTFVTGFFGMNFEHIKWKSDLLFWAVLVIVAALPVVMVAWFHKRRWV